MIGSGDFALVSGVLQLTIPSYSLRLVRRFGTERVGWFVMTAFAALALLNWLKPLRPMQAVSGAGMTLDIGLALAAMLLVIGMCHLETLLSERQECAREEQRLQTQWEQQTEEKTAGLVRTNQELLRQIARLEQTERALWQHEKELCDAQKIEVARRLACGVAHHFNNTLSIISGYASLLLHRAQDERSAEQLKQIASAVSCAAGLSRQLLITSGQFALRREWLQLTGLIMKLNAMVLRLVGPAIVVRQTCAPNLPRILADPRLIEHILINLVLNARDAMPGGGTLTISTDLIQTGDCQSGPQAAGKAGALVRLSIRDTGCGMIPEVEAHLFEPFFTTRGVGKGRGLGLASVQGAVTQHGGWIEYTTQPGAGTEFGVFFPVAPPAPESTESDFRRWIRH
jgi:C4-dicarboxylate-specific signal transduction histidine kinase